MKIGIITVHKSPNYGACLQSYALWRYLDGQGHDVEIIDLYRPHQKEYVKSRRFQPMRPVRRTLLGHGKTLVKKLLGWQKKQNLFSEAAKVKFDDFNAQINYSIPYYGIDELYANPPQYDLYVSGSDQLWNPTQQFCMEPYFLTFLDEDKKRISYASSIGITKLTTEEKEKFKKWLSSYSAISVRELQAKNLLDALSIGKEIHQVADPTFLLDASEWRNMAVSPRSDTPYILLFSLQWSKGLVDYALQLSHESGLRLVVLNQKQPLPAVGDYTPVTDAGPKDFLGYIRQAEHVITDSFHATVFSIIMDAKNFTTYISPSNQRGSRIVDLLDTYSLSNHLINDFNANYKALQANVINRESVMEILNKEQEKSRNFLKKYIHD